MPAFHENSPRSSKRPQLLWGGAFVTGMLGAGMLARVLDLGSTASMLIMLPPMALLVPMVRSLERGATASGCYSPAMRRYNRRFMAASLGYVAALFFAIGLTKNYTIAGPSLWIVALLPTVPIMAMIWTMARLLIEETDEYLRMKTVSAALIATGILLVAATLWGFLEMFGLAPHVWTWAAFPVWALGLGGGQLLLRTRS